MTRQNAIHKHIRKSEQSRKKLLRQSGGKRIPHHTRKWWKAWNKTFIAELTIKSYGNREKTNDFSNE